MRLNVLLTAGLIARSIIASAAPVAETTPLKLPAVERKALLNGMQFLFFDAESEDCPFLLMIENGAAFDPVDKWGVTYLMSRMILEGVVERNLRQEFESRGIRIESQVDWDAFYFLGTAPASQLEYALLALGDLVVHPDFREETFERLRRELLAELNEEAANIEARTEQVFQATVFADNPYGHSVRGEPRTVSNLYLRDIKIQQRRLLLPNQAKLAVYYSGDRELLFRRLSRRWGAWVRSEAAPFSFVQAERSERPRIRVLENQGSQGECLIRWGQLGVAKSAPEFFALKILEQYLLLQLPEWAEQVSRAGQIRGEVVLAPRRMPGYFQVSLASPVGDVTAYLRQLNRVLAEVKSGRIDEARFQEAKSLVKQEFLASMQDPFGRLMQVLAAELHQLGANFVATFNLRLDRVTPAHFQEVIRRAFPDQGAVVVVAAPAGPIVTDLQEFGDVELLH
ncbi:MAG: hypothetical protein Kow001_14900 [Acidobacteriota bacterium]